MRKHHLPIKVFSTLFIVIVIITSCNNKKNTSPASDDNVVEVATDDQSMNAAVAKAKQTFNQFDTAFRNGNFDTSLFSLKVRFETETGGEHIWTYGIENKDGSYYGIVDEDAVNTDKVKRGDRVKITTENMSDWLYADNGILIGGYTIRVLRNKMSPEERAAFDSSYYLKVID